MSEHSFVHTDGTENIEQYRLSIRVSPGGFSFSQIRVNDKTVIKGNNHTLKVKDDSYFIRSFPEWYRSEETLKIPVQRLEIVFYTEKFTFIPDSFFRPEKTQLVFRQLFQLTTPVKLVTSKLEVADYHFAFAIPEKLYQQITHLFDTVSFTHPVKLITDHPGLDFSGNQLVMFFTSGHFYVLLYRTGKLCLSNSFPFLHPNDVIFYTFHLLRKEKLQLAETPVILGGTPEIIKNIVPHLTSHFPILQIAEMNEGIVFGGECSFRPEYPLYSIFRDNP